MATTAYANYQDLLVFSDENTIKDLLSDTGNYAGDPATDPKFVAIANAASGQVQAACGVSQLYTATDLAALTGNSLALLKQIVCQLILVALVRRRPEKYASDGWQAVRKEAEEYLDRIRRGERLFDDSAKQAAGLPTVDGPTSLGYQRLNLLPSRTKNYFPSVAQRLPLGRG
jgi:hypothetical protein